MCKNIPLVIGILWLSASFCFLMVHRKKIDVYNSLQELKRLAQYPFEIEKPSFSFVFLSTATFILAVMYFFVVFPNAKDCKQTQSTMACVLKR